MLSGTAVRYFDRVACIAVVDFGESLRDKCDEKRVFGDSAAFVCRFCLLEL
jgi:hypothetical protein